MNYESDCSILDSSIPPKGVSQKQWNRSRQDTVKSILNSNNSHEKKKISPKEKKENETKMPSESIYSSNELSSVSFSLNSTDEVIKTPKRYKTESKNTSINLKDDKQKANKSKNLHQNQSKNNNNNNSGFQDSSSIASIEIDEFQNEQWLKKSIKSIESIRNTPKDQNDFESGKYFSNSSGSFKERKKQKKEIENLNKFSSYEKSNSEDQVDIKIDIDDESNSEENNGSEIIHVSCNRSLNQIKNVENSDDDDNNGNDDDKEDDDDIKNIHDYNDNAYKDKIKWELKSFNNIFDIESPKAPEKPKKKVKRIKTKKLRPKKSVNKQKPNSSEKEANPPAKELMKTEPNTTENQTKQKIVKKNQLTSRNFLINPKSNNQSKIHIDKKQVDSEVGQLELPSSSAYEIRPKFGSSEAEFEVNFFENEELTNTTQPAYISHINDNHSKSNEQKENESHNNEIIEQKLKSKLSTEINEKRRRRTEKDDSSDSQGEFIVQLQKNAHILSSYSESDDEKEHKDKTVSMNGIVLYMLSSSENGYARKRENEQNGQTFTISSIGNNLSESQKYSEYSYAVNENENKSENENESKNEKNSESGFVFEKNIEKEKTKRKRKNLVASLTIVQARGLPSLDVPRRDPYCLVNLKGSHELMKTKVMRDTTSPIWNNKFNFDIKNTNTPFIFTVRYEDKFGGDIDVAEAEMSIKNTEVGQFYESWIRLYPINYGSLTEEDMSPSIASCELYITLVLETKKAMTANQIQSPKTPQKVTNSPKNASSQKDHMSSSSSQKAVPSPLPSPLDQYEGELIMTITIVQAKNIVLPSDLSSKCGMYCAVNVVGRRDVRKTKTVFGTFSPIWDKQFKFILANRHDIVVFNIRVEDRNNGDLTIAKAKISVEKVPINSFADRRVVLHPLKKMARMPIRNEELIDQDENDVNMKSDKAKMDFNKPVGDLHFNLVLEPRIKDVPVSPRISPSLIGDATFPDFGYPESPMAHYIQRESENGEN